MAKNESAAEIDYEDPLVAMRVKLIEEYRKENPILGQFSPEQYLSSEGGMGEVFVSRWKGGMPFTNLRSKHVKVLLENYWRDEILQAALEKRIPRLSGLLAYFEWIMANLGGWLADQYVRTGIAGLAPPPKRPSGFAKLAFWRRH